ncbi:protein phtf isoform X2 [Sabethes cyaneus]|uniref:protein phtf isoform X2 n=1 Tax=Sabethes cyaneus TaxID=53552 RepID=UPI00237E2CA9|nr:protein phtf isoform X2 [Sabethes cyaneus]
MRLDELVAWYQKKIGTYDKQQWEKTLEQKILAGITHLPLKNTKLKTELIDVDLVRGSTFPKAKSKLSILTVIYLAALRLLFLPVYAKWWVQQTSPKVFILLLTLYLLQMINLGIYSYNVNKAGSNQEEHIVSITDFLIPLALSLLLSVIHSQIVATASNSGSLCHELKNCHLHSATKKRERVRKRRRARATFGAGTDAATSKCTHDDRNLQKTKNIYTAVSKSPTGSPRRTTQKQGACSTSSSTSSEALKYQPTNRTEPPVPHVNTDKVMTNIEESVIISSKQNNTKVITQEDGRKSHSGKYQPGQNIYVTEQSACSNPDSQTTSAFDANVVKATSKNETSPQSEPGCSLRRRNVNWDPHTRENCRTSNGTNNRNDIPVDDDGFESLNGKSSGGEDSSNTGITADAYFKKLPYTNTWIGGPQADKETRSDSDTDTLRNTSTIQELPPKTVVAAAHTSKPRQHLSSESGIEVQRNEPNKSVLNQQEPSDAKAGSGFDEKLESSGDTDEENDFDLHHSESSQHHLHHHLHHNHHHHHQHLSEGEECGYSSDLNHSDGQNEHSDDDYDLEDAPTIILNPPCGANDRVSCTIWDEREAKKAEMSVLDISSAIIERVEAMPETCDYVYIGVALSVILSLIPAFCRLCEATVDSENATEINFLEMPVLLLEKASFSCITILRFAFGESSWEKTVLIIGFMLRLCLTYLIFFLLAVAERTFKQRFLYAKLFSHLTSSRRAQKSGIPHFRLNKVRNIKTWLCVRSYLKRRGPQNSVDVIVSAAFIITLLLLAFLSVEWLKDSVHLHSQFNLEALVWSCAFGTFLLRFMTLGTKINKKYKSVSVLITEQINLYVQIEQKPNKKEELMISNNVLKLAADLLKELESPFKISGLSANPYLYTTVKVVILSALSGVLSEMLGFKLKLHKIKIK